MAKSSEERIAQLQRKRDQLNAQIKKETARGQQNRRKERNARLIQWGIVIEQMLENGAMRPDKLAVACRKYLSGRNLQRALTGQLAPYVTDNTHDQENANEWKSG